ncbi:MAG: O-antigen ligase family protein [Chloroflexi bacterium]|nr:O-antigen ligase family protein [Chloroflexota bacterium]
MGVVTAFTNRLQHGSWSREIEGIILLFCVPFLLFPTVSFLATFLALLLIIFIWLAPLFLKKWALPPATPFDAPLLLFGLMLIVAVLVTADPDLTLPKITGLILGLAVWRFFNRAGQTEWLVYGATAVYILLGFGFIFLGILSANWLYKIPAISQILAVLPTGLIALPGNAGGVHPNQLAGTLLFLFPFFLALLLGWIFLHRGKGGLVLWAALFLVTALLLLLTQSRTGWLAGLGSVFVVTVLWGLLLPRAHWLRPFVWGAVILMLLAGIAGIITIGPERLQSIWDDPGQQTAVGNLGSLGFRQEVWRWGVTAVQDFPFTGTGLGTYRRVVRRFYPINVAPDYDISHAHNLYLQTALDVGLPGLIIYLALIFLAVVMAWQTAKWSERLRPFAVGFLAVLAAFHIFGLTDALALGSKTTLVFWVMLGILSAMHRLAQKSTTPRNEHTVE